MSYRRYHSLDGGQRNQAADESPALTAEGGKDSGRDTGRDARLESARMKDLSQESARPGAFEVGGTTLNSLQRGDQKAGPAPRGRQPDARTGQKAGADRNWQTPKKGEGGTPPVTRHNASTNNKSTDYTARFHSGSTLSEFSNFR